MVVRALTRQGVRTGSRTKTTNGCVIAKPSNLAATATWKAALDAGDHKERMGVEFVSGNYFPMLGVEPAAGRVITAEDDRQNRAVAVISHAYWLRAFGGGVDAVGKELHLEKSAFEIIGVAPPGFKGEYDGDGMVMAEGFIQVGIGMAAGMAAALSLSHLVAKLLFGVLPYDAATFVAAAVILAVVAAAATYGCTEIRVIRAPAYCFKGMVSEPTCPV